MKRSMKNYSKHFWLTVSVVVMTGWLSICMAGADDFLDPDQAFKLTEELVDEKTVALNWGIAPGYKFYRERLHVNAEDKQNLLGEPVLPDGIQSFDENLGKNVETYHDQLAVAVPVIKARAPFTLTVEYQGCAEAGLCYPPIIQKYHVDPAHPGLLKPATEASVVPAPAAPANLEAPAVNAAEDDGSLAQRMLRGGSLAGVGLAFLTHIKNHIDDIYFNSKI